MGAKKDGVVTLPSGLQYKVLREGDKWEMYIPSELGYGDGGSGAKIKGGDVLIFQMEILKIKGGKKRATKCDVKSKDGCEPEEVAVLDEWSSKDSAAIDAELKALKKKLDGALKSGEREPLVLKKKMLTQVAKLKKKGVEL